MAAQTLIAILSSTKETTTASTSSLSHSNFVTPLTCKPLSFLLYMFQIKTQLERKFSDRVKALTNIRDSLVESIHNERRQWLEECCTMRLKEKDPRFHTEVINIV